MFLFSFQFSRWYFSSLVNSFDSLRLMNLWLRQSNDCYMLLAVFGPVSPGLCFVVITNSSLTTTLLVVNYTPKRMLSNLSRPPSEINHHVFENEVMLMPSLPEKPFTHSPDLLKQKRYLLTFDRAILNIAKPTERRWMAKGVFGRVCLRMKA